MESDTAFAEVLRTVGLSQGRIRTLTTTMNIYMKTVSGCSECNENPGSDVCNYCATREARKHANHVGIFASREVSKSRR